MVKRSIYRRERSSRCFSFALCKTGSPGSNSGHPPKGHPPTFRNEVFSCLSRTCKANTRNRTPVRVSGRKIVFQGLGKGYTAVYARNNQRNQGSPRQGKIALECFNDWGGRGCDDLVPGEVNKTTPSGDRITRSPTWSASLPRVQLISPPGWSNTSPSGAMFVPSPPKTGTNL